MWKGKTRGGVSGYLFFIYLDIGHRTVDHHLISYSHLCRFLSFIFQSD